VVLLRVVLLRVPLLAGLRRVVLLRVEQVLQALALER